MEARKLVAVVALLSSAGCASPLGTDIDRAAVDNDGLLTPEFAYALDPAEYDSLGPFHQTAIDPGDVFRADDLQDKDIVPGESFVCPAGFWYASVDEETSLENRCLISFEDGELPETVTLEADCDIAEHSRIGFSWAAGTAIGYSCPKDFTMVDGKACYRVIPTVPEGVRDFCGALTLLQYLGFAWDTEN